MKQKLFFLLVVLSFLLPVPLLAYDFESGGIYYGIIRNYDENWNIISTEAFVAQSPDDKKYSGDIVIPSTVEYQGQNLSVTSIGEHAFEECTSLTSVEIPNYVTSIGQFAFQGCTSLTSVEIPNSVTSIDNSAFYGCTSLTSVEIPNSVTSIANSAFYGCTSLTSVEIPNTVTSIGDGAFYGCTSLTSVEIPNSVTSIGSYAFNGCTSLTSVKIPNSVTSIANSAFYGCTSLTSVEIPNSVTFIGEYAFYGCTSLTSVEIPNSVTSIGDSAFAYTSLTSVEIPNSVTSIGNYAFYDCTSLTSVEIPNSVTSIGGGAFFGCTSLTSVEMPNSVTSIGNNAFYGCTSLTSVEIPNSVTSIDSFAFWACISLTSVEIPKSVTSIGDNAFAECSNLRACIILGSRVTFGESVFPNHCYIFAPEGLDSSKLSQHIIRCATENTIALSDGTIFTDNGKTLYLAPFFSSDSKSDYIIPEGVTKIKAEAFYNNRDAYRIQHLVSLTIPSTIEEIEPNSFLETQIEKVNFTDWSKWYANVKLGNLYSNPYWNSTPYVGGVQMVTPELTDGMTEIPDYINCGLQFKNEIELPRSIKRIGAYAFYNNKELFSVILPAGLEEIGESAFEGCTLLENPSFPTGLKKIEDGAYKGCTSFTEITLPEGLTILGSRPSGIEITDNNVAKGVFEGCTALEKAVVAIDIDYLADNVFKYCKGLNKIYFPLHLRTIGNSAFEECNALDEITFPATLESIGERAFKGEVRLPLSDGSLSKLVIPDGVSNIGKEAFAYQNIANLSIGSGVETIPDRAFYCNYSLKVINFSEGLKEIGEDAFSNTEYIRSNIGSVVLPSTVTSIGVNAFLNAYISSLVIPDGVESLGSGSCGRPSVLTIGSGIKDIAADAFNFDKLYTIRLKAHMPPSLSDAFPLTSEQNDQLTLIVNKDRHDTYNTNARWKQIDRILEEGESEVEIYLDGTYSLAEEIRIQSGYMPSVVTKMMVDGPLTATDLRVIKENMIALTSLDLSHVTNLTALPERQFEESLLTEIVLPSNLESIGDYAFNSCRLLELTELPASVKTIGDNAFSSCPKVNLKALPASLEKIGGYAFSGTGMLEVIAGEVLAEVGEGAFRDCKLLERVDLEATSLTEITDMAFSGCSELDEVILPPTVETIGSSTFSGTAIRNIDFASGVTEIGNYAFSNNRRLVSATLPKTLTTVGEGLFADCPRLISLSMPNVVTGVGSKIVSNDRKLASLSCSAPDAPEAATGAFDDVRYRYVTLTIPTLSFRNYLSAAQWGKFESTQNSIKVNMGKGLSITSTAEKEYQDMLNEDALEEAQEAAAVQSGKMSPARVMRRAATRAKTTQNFATVFDGAQLMQGKEGGANRIFITPDPNVTITSILFDGQELLASYDGQSILLPEGKSGSLEILTDAPSTYSITASSSDKAKGAVEIKGGGESVSGGSAVTVTATPVAGYEFVNWTAEGNEVSTENPYQFTVSQNIALVANFKAKKYDVKFVYGNGEEDAVKNLEFGAVIPAPENPTRTGYTFTGWNPAFEDGVTVPVDGITYTATWSINKYTISFDSDGGSEVASITLDYGSDVTVPAAPTKTGYTFKGWDKEIPAKMPAGDMSVKALWTVNKYTITYMVDNSVYKTLDVDYGSAIVAESAPEKEGYTFSGWTGLPETMPAQDVTVKGEFTVNSYTLSIYLNGELYSTKDIEYGAVLNIETPTVPQDYIFDGWTEALPETMPAHEVKIYGTYSKDPSAGVDFTLDNDSVVTVYTLSGALICKDKTWREVMQTLEKGIYIVSGKKVVIR